MEPASDEPSEPVRAASAPAWFDVVGEELRRRHEDFEAAGMRLKRGSAKPAESDPNDLPGFLSFQIIESVSDEIVGEVFRRLLERDGRKEIGHRQLRIWPKRLRRLGFGNALYDAELGWYREAGIEYVSIHAEGDGSLFAAKRDFDFDLKHYVRRGRHQTEEELRVAALQQLRSGSGVRETVERGEGQKRQEVRELLAELAAANRALVEEFEQRFPKDPDDLARGSFRTPQDVLAFHPDEHVEDGLSLGAAVLSRARWSGVVSL